MRVFMTLPEQSLIFRDKVHDFIKLMKDVRGLEDLVQNWSLYFSWCSFQSFFKKLTCPSRLAHAGENGWEIAKRELSNWQLLLSFLSNCGVHNSAENAVTWSRLSYLEMGGNIQISNLLKTSAIDVQSARVFCFAFSSYFTTGLCA